MTAFKTGVHTIEFRTPQRLDLDSLPQMYKGAVWIKEGRYVLTIPKIRGMPEYSTPADTQKAIEEAFTEFVNMGAGYPKVTRIDYRFDDHDGAYSDHLQRMTVLVNLIAHESGIYDRRVFYADGNDAKTSVRCMPHSDDHSTRYGIEYYDKLKEHGSAEHGKARLEFRRLNMEGETVQCILREWRNMLQSITRRKYISMLEAHARSLHNTKQDSETAAEFIKRTRSKLIAYEEWNIIHKISGKHSNHYDKAAHLPKWAEVKSFIDDLTAQLDEALNQPQTSSFHPDSVMNELPF